MTRGEKRKDTFRNGLSTARVFGPKGRSRREWSSPKRYPNLNQGKSRATDFNFAEMAKKAQNWPFLRLPNTPCTWKRCVTSDTRRGFSRHSVEFELAWYTLIRGDWVALLPLLRCLPCDLDNRIDGQ